ncbi:MAG: cell wall hydrolase [Bacillota bacterium]
MGGGRRRVRWRLPAALGLLVVVGILASGWPGRPEAEGAGRWQADNLNLLAQVVCGEARGEPYEGKVAVAAVILNRVDDRRFPNTVAGVVYQPLAFESVANGEIYRGTTQECFRAARDALNGWDPSYGAVFFFAPDKTKNKYIWSRPQVRQIGKHIFAR